MNRDEVIRKIVDEKGEEAIPLLLDLLEKEDDEVANICLDALCDMGSSGIDALFKKLKEIVSEGRQNDITALYIVDRLSDIGETRIVPLIYSMLKLYDSEEAQVILYEALAKLGEGDKVVDLLSMLLKEAVSTDFRDQIIMALSYTGSMKALKALVELYNDDKIDKATKAFLLEALQMMLVNRPEFIEVVKNLKSGKEIIDKIYFWGENRESK
jgi:HEAT repeat protein